jgi:outer membrane murein-binding lipoprotein Lpp
MKRLLMAGVVASVTLLGAASLAPSPASATDPITRLQRQVRVLQSQVAQLKSQVRSLNDGVYKCEFFDNTMPKTFPDGSVGYPLYVNSTGGCI